MKFSIDAPCSDINVNIPEAEPKIIDIDGE
jgi:hypothetical protein